MHDRSGMQDDKVTVTENAAYYSRMADWFNKQGWRDEAEEYKKKYSDTLLNEALAEKKRITEAGDNIIFAATAATVIGVVAAVWLLPLMAAAVAEGGLSFSITSFLKPRLLMMALEHGTPQFIRSVGSAPAVTLVSGTAGGAVGSTTLGTTAAAIGAIAPQAMVTTATASVGLVTRVIATGTILAVLANTLPPGPNQQPLSLKQTDESFAKLIDNDAFAADPAVADRLSRAELFDIGGYKDLTSQGAYGRVGDNLDSDEALQNAYVRIHRNVGRSAKLLEDNPALALDPSLHRQVANLKTPQLQSMSASQALDWHINQLKPFTPDFVWRTLQRESQKYISKIGL